MTRLQRWPLHPQPESLESLSSWVQRIASEYQMSVGQLLGANLEVVDPPRLKSLDRDPPIEVLTGLAERTGTELGQIRAMTLSGWVPWLFDCLDVTDDGRDVFESYVRGDSVLLARGRRRLPRPLRRWRGPWLLDSEQAQRRVCPVCVSRDQPRRSLVWDLQLTVSCIEHRCRLEDADEVTIGRLTGNPVQPVAISGPLATLDDYTHQALTVGFVHLPGRPVHAGIWFRLLRTIIDELTLSVSTLGKQSRHTIETVWSEAGMPVRCGRPVWQPYEHLPWHIQEQLLLAAAVALREVADHRLTAHGNLGSALAAQPHKPVYAGDDPDQGDSLSTLMAQLEEVLSIARADARAARNILAFLTAFDDSTENYGKQRRYLIEDVGIPPEYFAAHIKPVSPLVQG